VLATCGNGQVELGEQCDGIDLGGASCTSLGFIGGMLTCTANCGYQTQSCIPVVCGDGVVSAGEACDDGNLTSGDGCNAACSVEAGWTCTGAPSVCVHSCGNGTLETGEPCDGASLGGQTCALLGFAGGTLACHPDCTFDTSACAAAICGNGAIEPGESCDGANLGGRTCADFGFPAGTLACASCGFDTGGCLACAAQGCQSNLAPNAKTCSNAREIGRVPASGTAHLTGDTTNAGNNDDLSSGGAACYDAKYDMFYRIYLMAGDQINVTLDPLDADFDAMMKLYSGTDCAANGSGDLIGCYQSAYDGGTESLAFTAVTEGWYTLVVDGRYAFDDDYDYGSYALDVTLSCATAGCCCS
jgi:cysteine-rich repeat protein